MAAAKAAQARGSAEYPIIVDSETDLDTSVEVASPVKVVCGEKFRDMVRGLSEVVDMEDSEDSETEYENKPQPVIMSPSGVPIYEYPPEKYSSHDMMRMLLNPSIDPKRIAKQRPLETTTSSTFIVDVRNLKHRDDIKKDMYGKWKHHGSHIDVFKCKFGEHSQVCVEKVAEGASGDDVFYLRRLHSIHPSNKHFRRIVALISDSKHRPHHLCMVVYYVPDGFTPTIEPHGNSKKGKAFFPTLPSTLCAIKEQCSSGKGPKEVMSNVSGAVGGVQNALDACELPRNEQQVSYMKKKLKSGTLSSSTAVSDELSIVMQKAYMEDRCFIREVRTLREPAIVVATDRQLSDLERFCCRKSNFGVLTVDPTFSLGDFDVTVTTYRHLLLMCRRSGTHPAFIGPIMIHYRKTFSSYLFFSSTLVGIRQSLSALRSFGTDGESALIKAFKHSFPSAIHLLCSNHVRRNVKDKLHELRISESAKTTIVSDIFGQHIGGCHFEGLVDAKSNSEFEDGVSTLTAKWAQLDDPQQGPVKRFVSWFLAYKKDDIQHGLIRPVRKKAGLGDQPAVFTTNASESINAVLKSKVQYKKNELPVLIDKLKEVIEEQDNEVERAVIDRGKYELCPEYKRLECNEQQWFLRMSVDKRKAHIEMVLNFDPSRKPCSRCLFSKESSNSSIPSSHPSTSSHSSDIIANGCSGEFSCIGSDQSAGTYHNSVQSSCHDEEPGCLDELDSGFQYPEDSLPLSQQSIPSSLSVSVNELSSLTTPIEVLQAIWNKASYLVREPNAVLPAPGCDSSARMVKSTSGSRPHLVVRKKSGQFCCDGACPNWCSLGICAHSVAAAEDNQSLKSFVAWFAKAKKIPNLTQLTTSQMPAGRGRKGTVPPRKKRKTVLSNSRKSFSDIIFHQNPVSVAIQHPSASMTQTNVSVSGGSSVTIGPTTSVLPLSPPPLIHASPESSPENTPFILAFITGNIRVCRGCRQKYEKPAMPPNNLCVRHTEWQTFGPVGDRQERFGNVYFHCNAPCVKAVWPNFTPEDLSIPPSIIMQLLPAHTEYIRKHMPGRL